MSKHLISISINEAQKCEFRWGWIFVAEAIGEGWLRQM
jgi:hypothetical protein